MCPNVLFSYHYIVYMWWPIRNLWIDLFCVPVMMICNSAYKIDYMLIYNFDYYCRREILLILIIYWSTTLITMVEENSVNKIDYIDDADLQL